MKLRNIAGSIAATSILLGGCDQMAQSKINRSEDQVHSMALDDIEKMKKTFGPEDETVIADSEAIKCVLKTGEYEFKSGNYVTYPHINKFHPKYNDNSIQIHLNTDGYIIRKHTDRNFSETSRRTYQEVPTYNYKLLNSNDEINFSQIDKANSEAKLRTQALAEEFMEKGCL